jgi:hypothetical protein
MTEERATGSITGEQRIGSLARERAGADDHPRADRLPAGRRAASGRQAHRTTGAALPRPHRQRAADPRITAAHHDAPRRRHRLHRVLAPIPAATSSSTGTCHDPSSSSVAAQPNRKPSGRFALISCSVLELTLTIGIVVSFRLNRGRTTAWCGAKVEGRWCVACRMSERWTRVRMRQIRRVAKPVMTP